MNSEQVNVGNRVPEDDCTGCSACMNICPVNAISMAENIIGHIFPKVDSDKCINCGKCIKTCPSLNIPHKNLPDGVYAGWAKNLNEHLSSTSGGIATAIAKMILYKGGIVYASAFTTKPEIKHIRITKIEDLDTVRGSKYTQSNISFILRPLKEDLTLGKEVLFIGTPCQVAGLKNYLGRDYGNLRCIGLVCHGVPPQKLLFEHLRDQGVDLSKIDNVTFRNQAGFQYVLTVYSGNEILYRRTLFQDLYYSAFNDCLTSRKSCIKCQYANQQRVEDITLGDFHGLGNRIPFDNTSGGNISLILVNNGKGASCIDKALIENRIVVEQRTLQEALKYNPQLRMSSRRRANYSIFIKLYSTLGFKWAGRIVMFRRLIKNKILSFKFNS